MSRKRLFRLALGLLVAALFVWLTGRKLGPDQLIGAFYGTSGRWVLAGFGAFALGYMCRIERWRLMLLRENPTLSWHRCAGPLLSGFAANNVLPFRAGDVLRAFAFTGQLGVSSGVIVATLAVERLLDLLTVLILFGSALMLFGLEASAFAGIGGATAFLVAAAALMLLLFPSLLRPLALFAGKVATVIAPERGPGLRAEIEKSLATLQHLARGATLLRLMAWSLMAWVAEGAVFWCASLALPSLGNHAAAWLALPVGTLATLIPSTPGYIGTFDYFTVRAMTALGNGVPAATAFALLMHAMLWLPPTLIGGSYLLFRPARPLAWLKAS